MGGLAEYLFAEAVDVAGQAAHKQGWQQRGRVGWRHYRALPLARAAACSCALWREAVRRWQIIEVIRRLNRSFSVTTLSE